MITAETPITLILGVILILILLSAYFSSSETAMMALYLALSGNLGRRR